MNSVSVSTLYGNDTVVIQVQRSVCERIKIYQCSAMFQGISLPLQLMGGFSTSREVIQIHEGKCYAFKVDARISQDIQRFRHHEIPYVIAKPTGNIFGILGTISPIEFEFPNPFSKLDYLESVPWKVEGYHCFYAQIVAVTEVHIFKNGRNEGKRIRYFVRDFRGTAPVVVTVEKGSQLEDIIGAGDNVKIKAKHNDHFYQVFQVDLTLKHLGYMFEKVPAPIFPWAIPPLSSEVVLILGVTASEKSEVELILKPRDGNTKVIRVPHKDFKKLFANARRKLDLVTVIIKLEEIRDSGTPVALSSFSAANKTYYSFFPVPAEQKNVVNAAALLGAADVAAGGANQTAPPPVQTEKTAPSSAARSKDDDAFPDDISDNEIASILDKSISEDKEKGKVTSSGLPHSDDSQEASPDDSSQDKETGDVVASSQSVPARRRNLSIDNSESPQDENKMLGKRFCQSVAPKLQAGSGTKPALGSGAQPGVASGANPGIASGANPGIASGANPGVVSVAKPGVVSVAKPGNASVAKPGNASVAKPGVGSGGRAGPSSDGNSRDLVSVSKDKKKHLKSIKTEKD